MDHEMHSIVAGQEFPHVSVRKQAHVLIVASFHGTHFDILLQLLHHLARKYPGTTVTVVSSKGQTARLERFRHRGDLASLNLHCKDLFGNPVHLNEGNDSNFSINFVNEVKKNRLDAESFRKELVANKDAPGAPSCIVSSKFHDWSADWASELGLPWYVIYPQPFFPLVAIEMQKLGDAELKPDALLSDIIPGAVPARILSLVYARDLPEPFYDQPEVVSKHAESIKGAAALLVNSSEGQDLQGEAVDELRTFIQSSKVLSIGPIVQYPGFGINLTDSVDNYCLEWLDSQHENSVLYVAFGTLAPPSNASILDIATGLEASGVPFLWVLRLGSRELSEVLPPGFVDRTKGRGKIETCFVPQVKILSHVSIGGFLSQGGWNSLMEAVCADVPVIVWPMGGDQQITARYIGELAKIGYSISDFKKENKHTFEDIGSHEIEKAVRHVMEEKAGDVRRNMKAMQKIIKADMAEGGSSYQNLHAFLDEIANP